MKTLAELKEMTFVPHHDCACCGQMVGWYVDRPTPFFDPSCDCGCGFSQGHYDTWENVFKWFNSVFEKESDQAVNEEWQRLKQESSKSVGGKMTLELRSMDDDGWFDAGNVILLIGNKLHEASYESSRRWFYLFNISEYIYEDDERIKGWIPCEVLEEK